MSSSIQHPTFKIQHLTLSIIWIWSCVMLAERFGIPSADGIMYSLPFAQSRHALDLGVPFLQDFHGYGSNWGHHWPGAMWLRGAVFQIVPYSRAADLWILHGFQWIVATCTAALVWKLTGSKWRSLAVWLVLLSDRLMLQACAGSRFETVAVAAVVLMLADSLTSHRLSHTISWRALMGVSGALAASSHPYSLLLGGAILCGDLWVRRGHWNELRPLKWKATGFASGIAACGLWFVVHPVAWQQFTANLALQNSFYTNSSAFWAGLQNYRLQGGVVLWLAGAVSAGFWLMRYLPRRHQHEPTAQNETMLLLAGLLALVAIIHVISQCENFHYLAFGAPLALLLIATVGCVPGHQASATQATSCHSSPWLSRGSLATLTILVLLHGTILPFRLFQFAKAGFPDFASDYRNTLAKLPADRTILIPHDLWAAAIDFPHRDLRWFTFPIASKKETRKAYEAMVYPNLKPGDLLILPATVSPIEDRFGVYPTFPITPPDPMQWKLISESKRTFAGSVEWSMGHRVYEKKS